MGPRQLGDSASHFIALSRAGPRRLGDSASHLIALSRAGPKQLGDSVAHFIALSLGPKQLGDSALHFIALCPFGLLTSFSCIAVVCIGAASKKTIRPVALPSFSFLTEDYYQPD